MDPKLQAVKSALELVFDTTYEVSVRRDHATGYVADASTDAKIPDRYFFSYGKTEKSAVKGLVKIVEDNLRCRLDKSRTGLNTLLG